MKLKIKYYKLSMIIVLLLTVSYCSAQNQSDTSMHRIETRDGNTYMGQIVSKDSVKVILDSDKSGKIKILQDQIKKMHPVDTTKIKNGKNWIDNPQATRYFYAPNGNALKKGEGYYQNVGLLFNSFAVGVEDNFSIGGGLAPLPLFTPSANFIPTSVWINPKFSIPSKNEKLSLEVGALFGTVLGLENTGSGIPYGISTFGSKDKNISAGLGYAHIGGGRVKSLIVNLSAMVSIWTRGYIITENYLIHGKQTTTVILSFGGRQVKLLGDWSLDYGLIIESENFMVFPWLGLTLPFGKETSKKPSSQDPLYQ